MKIGVVVNKPMHFDVPFFRFVAESADSGMTVIYTSEEHLAGPGYDPEIGASLSWGLDLLGGYEYVIMPRGADVRWMKSHLQEQHYDLLIVNGYNTRGAVAALIASRSAQVQVALRLDSALFNNTHLGKLAAKRALFVWLRQTCSHFFAVSKGTAKLLERLGVDRHRISYFPYTVNLAWFETESAAARVRRPSLRERFGLPTEPRPVILSVAKFSRREAPWDLIDAFDMLSGTEACLWLVGDGPDRPALEARAREVTARIVFGGYVPFQDLPSVYAASDIFVHPAANEPWGVSVQEALASGLPVIGSSHVGAAQDLIEDGLNGYVYECGDVADLSRKIERLLQRDIRQLCESDVTVLRDYTYEVIWERVLSVARTLAEG